MATLTSRSLMTNDTIVLYSHDRILAKTVLPLIPNWVKPNHLTVVRFISIPFVAYLTWTENWAWLIPVFILSGLTDMFDGTLARVRKQITLWGTIADPAADKLLIGSVAVLFLAKEVSFLLAFVLVFLEFLIILGAYVRKRRGEYISANWSGKMKMLLQVIAIAGLIIGKLFALAWLTPICVALIITSFFFAIVSLVTYGL